MKLLTLLFILFGPCLFAQDIIILKTGDETQAKVLEVTTTEVKYKPIS